MEENQNNKPAPEDAWKALVAIPVFIAWVALYLIVLRPILLQAIMSFYNTDSLTFPAMLHLIPIIGLPVLIIAAIAQVVEKFKGKVNQQ
jgi:hypothetical protein